MITYRVTTTQDIPQLRALWQLCFGDSDSFLDFYFDQRFVPNLSVCTELDGEIIGAIFGLPTQMHLQQLWVSCAMSSGFCTHPDHRGKGYFTHLFSLYMSNLRDNHIVLAVNTPVRHDGYFSLEQRTLTDSRKLTGIPESAAPVASIPWDTGSLWKLYHGHCATYSGALWRSYRDMALRLSDLQADGGHILAVPGGYGLYYVGEDLLTAVEVVADSETAYQALVDGLCALSCGRAVSLKLPPDTMATAPGLTATVYPQGVGGIVDLEQLLRQCPIQGDFTIVDPICPWNNLTLGEGTTTLSTGHLLQHLVGYVTHPELVAQFPKQTCYIPDEY